MNTKELKDLNLATVSNNQDFILTSQNGVSKKVTKETLTKSTEDKIEVLRTETTQQYQQIEQEVEKKATPSYVDEAVKGVVAGTAEINGLSRNGSSLGKIHTIKNPIKPCISFSDDDGKVGVYTKWKPILQEKGIPMSICVITDMVGKGGYLTWQQLRELQNDLDCEILSHTDNHNNFNSRYNSEIISMLKNTKEILMSNGLRVNGFAYPNGGFYSKDNGSDVSYLCANEYEYAVITQKKINNYPISNSMKIDRLGIGCYDTGIETLDKMKAKVDECITNNGWLIFMTHVDDVGHTEEDTQNIRDLIDYIKSKNVNILTIKDGYKRFGNIVESESATITNQGEVIGGTGGGYILPKATVSTLGGIKVGSGLNIDNNGVLSSNDSSDLSNYYTIDEVDYFVNQLKARVDALENGTEPPPTITVESVSLDKSSHTFKVDETLQLNTAVLPSNATNKTVTWSSSDTTKATVVNGLVTAKAEGSCVITVTTLDGNKSATCNLTIQAKNIPPVGEIVSGYDFYFDIKNATSSTMVSNYKTITFESNKVASNIDTTGLVFDGVDDSLSKPNSNGVLCDFANNCSLAITFKLTDENIAISKIKNLYSDGRFTILATGETIKLSFKDMTSNAWKNTAEIKLSSAGIYNIVIQNNNNNFELYLDKVKKTTFDATAMTFDVSPTLNYSCFGSSNTRTSNNMPMTFYNTIYYTRALTQEEINTNYNALTNNLI